MSWAPGREDAEAAERGEAALQVGGEAKSRGGSIPTLHPIYPLAFEGFRGDESSL